MAKKLALVTGGTRGIGAEIAKKLHTDGHEVLVIYIGRAEPAKFFTSETKSQRKNFLRSGRCGLPRTASCKNLPSIGFQLFCWIL